MKQLRVNVAEDTWRSLSAFADAQGVTLAAFIEAIGILIGEDPGVWSSGDVTPLRKKYPMLAEAVIKARHIRRVRGARSKP